MCHGWMIFTDEKCGWKMKKDENFYEHLQQVLFCKN